jgi:hypothetical protein
MRHIPEEELHAYLDQGLSRSQCVEIESHLARCPSCQANRDGIAALRDRTTALLAQLAPTRSVPPSLEGLRHRAAEQLSVRHRRVQRIGWAASMLVAVGLGWSGSSLVRRLPTTPDRVAVAPVRSPAPAGPPAAGVAPSSVPASALPAAMRPAHRTTVRARDAASTSPPATADSAAARRAAALSVLNPAPALELSTVDAPHASNDEELDGMWRTMSWDGAQAEAGQQLPHIDGLPVVQVQVQGNEPGKRPLMVVAQQLSSGQVIRTIEGPTPDVSQLLARRAMTDPDSISLRGDSTAASGTLDQAMAMQLGDRMLAITGALPSDSLRAMIRRLNAEMRSK